MTSSREETATQKRVIRLRPGESFPPVRAPRVGGGRIELPEDVENGWAVVLFYRGNWCPYCTQQLKDFQRNLDRFRSADIRVVALSSDPEAEAKETVDGNGLEFPVGFGLDPAAVHDRIGAYLGEDQAFVQATGFVLRPGGIVQLAVYSSGAVGRLVARDVLGMIEYARTHG